MIENLRIRIVLSVLCLIGGLAYLVPNFVDFSDDDWWMTKDKIVYGLDIQGGLHLVLGVDIDGVLRERTDRQATAILAELANEGVQIESAQRAEESLDKITLTLKSASQEAEVEAYLGRFYSGVLQSLGVEGEKMTLRFLDAAIEQYRRQVVDQAIEVIRNRIDEFGVSEPNIASQGSNRILVQLPGIQDSARAKDLINRTARLDFRLVKQDADLGQLQTWIQESEAAGKYRLGASGELDEEGVTGLAYSDYVVRLNKDLEGKLPEGHSVVFQKAEGAQTLEAGKFPYVVRKTGLTGDMLEDANVGRDPQKGYIVSFRFNVDGRRRFAEITGDNAPGVLAIVLDEVVKSAPSFREKIDSEGAQIELGRANPEQTYNEAQLIATTLRAGALPAKLEQLEERTVGPTLGADSIAAGKMAGLVGLVLVLVFMLFWYKTLGVVANLALMMNMVLILALLSSLGATLTLPGVAGIILTIGMAVDANVIIFERIREELRKGAGLKSAVKDGFGHAFSAVFDANITTALVCIVLMYFGTGPIRGFAVTLLCGIATSMFTAIFVSRTIIEVMMNKFGLKTLAMK